MKHSSNLIFGSRAVIESILAGQTIEKVFLQRNKTVVRFKELYELMRQYAIPFSYVPIEKFKQWRNDNHQGVVALSSPIPFVSLEEVVQSTFEQGRMPLVVVLDGVTDVHNLGAIVRTAKCMEVDALVVPMQGSASISAVAMKTSAGALATLPLCRVDHIHKSLSYLQACGLTLIACHEKATTPIYQVELKLPVALILGDEAMGISAKHLAYAQHQVLVPIHGPIASLNVSVAAGILLYEVFRQRHIGSVALPNHRL